MIDLDIQTDFPFCYDSADYKDPLGSANDYHSNPRFIDKLEKTLNSKELIVLDLGCANGSQVVEFLKRGHLAYGIDGSDYGVKNKTGGWGSNPDNFKNADLTKPYQLYWNKKDGVKAWFDVVTAWDVLEHIAESDLPQFFTNIKNHFKYGLCFFGIAMFPCGEHHRTVQNEAWWRQKLDENGFKLREDLMASWTQEDYVCPCETPDRKFHAIVELK